MRPVCSKYPCPLNYDSWFESPHTLSYSSILIYRASVKATIHFITSDEVTDSVGLDVKEENGINVDEPERIWLKDPTIGTESG